MFRNEVATSSLTPTTGPDLVTTVTGTLAPTATSAQRSHRAKTIFGLCREGFCGVSASSSLPMRVRATVARVSAAGFRRLPENSVRLLRIPHGLAGVQQHVLRAY
jgi:hypothetical protein